MSLAHPIILSLASAGADPVALCQALALPGEAGAPDWIHLLPAGEIRTVDGRGPYRLRDAAAVVAASLQATGRLPIDENHALDLAAPRGESSPARGWIVELQARADGIWGRVEWTSAGRTLVEDRAYRHISPAIAHRADGTVVAIARASLVNRPNLTGLVALNQETSMDLTKLRKALGLPDTASEAEILAAAEARPALSFNATQAAAIAGMIGMEACTDPVVVLQSMQRFVDPARMVPAEQVVALQQQLTALTQATARDKATAFVDGAIKAGRVGVKPLRDHYIARHMADPTAVEKEVGAMVALQGARPASPAPAPKDGEAALTDADRTVVALMGLDPTVYAKRKASIDATAEEAL